MHRPWFTRRVAALVPVVVVAVLLAASPAAAQWQLASPDGKATLKLGLLLQPRFESVVQLETAPATGSFRSQNLLLRRARVLLGGKVDEHLSFFVDTDCPNLGKAGATGKDAPDMYLQDVVATWKPDDRFGVDAGLLLTPGTYNHMQGATTLYAVEYGPYTFLTSTPLQQKVGRDVGVQLRGALAGKHVEYRVGAFQGYREARSTQPLHLAARLSVTPYAVDPGFFYPGTSLGATRRLQLGVAAEGQSDFRAVHGDLVVEQPLGGVTATFQGDVSRVDGGRTFASLPQQTDWMVEGGFTVEGRWTPYVQIARQIKDGALADESSVQAGIALWRTGHRSNLKAAWTWLSRTGTEMRDQFVLQAQVYAF